jgi:hypothetical protein
VIIPFELSKSHIIFYAYWLENLLFKAVLLYSRFWIKNFRYSKKDYDMNSLLVLVLLVLIASINAKINTTNIPENSYLFSYFDADEKAGLRIAYSTDGYVFEVMTDFLKLNILIMLLYFYYINFSIVLSKNK